MIHTSRQLKDKVRNISGGSNDISQMLIRNFIMERFLERVSCSRYKNNFILKGGMLVASMLGIESRATMDIDTTVEALPLNPEDAMRIVREIISIQIEDGVSFTIVKVSNIMTDFEYPGVRMILEARLDQLKQRIKIDISTDDVITPSAIIYNYKLMFEKRTIEVKSYTAETILAEKIQTILARNISTTRLRDFYDVYEIIINPAISVDEKLLREAFCATCKKRDTMFEKSQINNLTDQIMEDSQLLELWERYRKDNFYVGDLSWNIVCKAVCDYVKNLSI